MPKGMNGDEILEAEIVESPESMISAMPVRTNPLAPAVGVIALSLIFVTSMIIVFIDFSEPIDYELIDFDQDRARGYAQDLVDLGHPEWKDDPRFVGNVQRVANRNSHSVKAKPSRNVNATLDAFFAPYNAQLYAWMEVQGRQFKPWD